MKNFKDYLVENDDYEWQDAVNDNYSTIDLKGQQIFEVFKKFIYDLPKKYNNKKEVIKYMKDRNIKYKAKDLNDYLRGLDESRLEELVGIIHDSLRKVWWM